MPRSLCHSLLEKPSNTKPSVSLCRNVEEDEAINHGKLAPVQNGPEPVCRVSFEVGDCHLTARDESCHGTKKPECDRNPCTELDDSGHETLRIMQLLSSPQNAKQLLGSMASEKKPHTDAHKRVRNICKPPHISSGRFSFNWQPRIVR